jgi:pentatricopeptide repeat protein
MVVNGYAASGDVKEALRWLKRMPERFVTAITYHGLIAALCEAGDTKGALAQLAAMRKVGLVPLPRTMRLLLEGFGADQLDD